MTRKSRSTVKRGILATGATMLSIVLMTSANAEKTITDPQLWASEGRHVYIPAANRIDAARVGKMQSVDTPTYLKSIQSAASCLDDALRTDSRITNYRVDAPTGIGNDEHTIGYTVMFETHLHGKGVVLGPEEMDFVRQHDAACRATHVGRIEKKYQSDLRHRRGPDAAEALAACLDVKLPDNADKLAVRRVLRQAVSNGAGPDCFIKHEFAVQYVATDE